MILAVATLLIIIFLSTTAVVRAENQFQPYQINGGLVSAVAGKDFVVIASDTRFAGEGEYDIVSRDHWSSRLWMVGGNDDDSSGLLLLPKDPTAAFVTKTSHHHSSPAFIGSVGCSTDCEQLKRMIQMEVRSAIYFGECSHAPHPPINQIATLLSQVLYSRRMFPFYSFCVVAGIDKDDNESLEGEGQVFVYDAIGSYEQVAVASTGTGRELLQPILDRKFRTAAAAISQPSSANSQEEHQKQEATTSMITTTVPTIVDCTPEEAISILVDGYRSVSEREIGVGDHVVVCVARRRGRQHGGGVECQVQKYPLKQH